MQGPTRSGPVSQQDRFASFIILEGKTMKKEHPSLYIFNTHVEAEGAIQSLIKSDFDVKNFR
jgi:hypothetical protein